MTRILRPIFLILAFVAAALTTEGANAGDWPDRPITMIIMSKEGGGMDRASRMIGDALSTQLGQPMKYVNRPGASGEIALKSFINAKNDGYTVFSGNIPTLMVMIGTGEKDYDIGEDVSWLGGYLVDPALLITSSSSEITSLDDFITKAQQSKQRVGVANWASVQTLALLQLQKAKDLQLEIIPYSGFKKASTALLGNHIEAAIGNFSATEKLGDKVRYLGVFASELPDGRRDVPAIADATDADIIDAASIRALAIHKGLKEAHPERFDTLNSAYEAAITDPDFPSGFQAIGADPSQAVQWGEAEAGAAADSIIDLIDEIGDAFNQSS